MPGSKQACPKSAACWSPRTPETGTPSSTADAGPRSASAAAPKRPADGRTSGRVCTGTPKRSHSSGGPGQGRRIEQQGAAGVGRVGGVGAARRPAGEVPQDPGVDGAEGEARVAGRQGELAGAQQPGRLGGAEVRVEDEPRRLAHEGQVAGAGQLGAQGRRAAVLPDDGPVQRLPGRAVEGHEGLALVGDADGRHGVAGLRPGGRRPRPGWPAPRPRSRRGRARPSPGGGSAGSARGRRRRRPGPARRRRGHARRSCPHRWRRPWPWGADANGSRGTGVVGPGPAALPAQTIANGP